MSHACLVHMCALWYCVVLCWAVPGHGRGSCGIGMASPPPFPKSGSSACRTESCLCELSPARLGCCKPRHGALPRIGPRRARIEHVVSGEQCCHSVAERACVTQSAIKWNRVRKKEKKSRNVSVSCRVRDGCLLRVRVVGVCCYLISGEMTVLLIQSWKISEDIWGSLRIWVNRGFSNGKKLRQESILWWHFFLIYVYIYYCSSVMMKPCKTDIQMYVIQSNLHFLTIKEKEKLVGYNID